jgi:hypothetical protein
MSGRSLWGFVMLELIIFGLLILAIATLLNLWPQTKMPAHSRPGTIAGSLPRIWGSPAGGSHRLHNQLLRLLRGDRKAANRLLEHVREMHPGRSERWYYEKVIYDLQRDRRA